MHESKLYRLHDPFFHGGLREDVRPHEFLLYLPRVSFYRPERRVQHRLSRLPGRCLIPAAVRRYHYLRVHAYPAPLPLSDWYRPGKWTGKRSSCASWIDYNVDYVFAGDFHSYFRADREHTKYIVTGGGGSHLRGGGRGFHHALLMTVDPAKDRVDEVIYPIKPRFDPGDSIETDHDLRDISHLRGASPHVDGGLLVGNVGPGRADCRSPGTDRPKRAWSSLTVRVSGADTNTSFAASSATKK